jgi:hypothetical protein
VDGELKVDGDGYGQLNRELLWSFGVRVVGYDVQARISVSDDNCSSKL